MNTIQLNTAAEKIIQDSINPKKTREILEFTLNQMKTINSIPDETQTEVLANHVAEMVERSEDNNQLDDVDVSVFDGLPNDSVELAGRVIDEIGNLKDQEKYILAVHFEVARK
ncbi:hypothetical protein M5C72_01335 [Companilactobacillus allii]|uniref:PRD domain-containing protein n=1 Tax=Companilactobacillus allii TaxID=1847728 RepID=A0A1P8Q1T2_9LACO|nr:hypothetical protein [Companilactobacillus allii]APX71818.1 hypothetical protein BTM29_04270 [Companilactobacillus allii]USQ69833.1 hypothetical protein M5C72_01335 [Companilactobacillus allii]